MKKQFKSIEEQVALLKERNLIIENEKSVKRYLLNNNYYDVINQYSKFFMLENDMYDEKITFKDIKMVHNFDKTLKRIFLSAILELEHQFKSIIAHRYAEYFKDNLSAYLVLEKYEIKEDRARKEVEILIKKLERIIKRKINSSTQNSIKHYYNTNNKEIPLWVLVSYMTLGHLVYLYKYLPDKLQNQINRDLSYFVLDNCKKERVTQFISSNSIYLVIENIRQVRNIVAHNNMLLNFKCEYNIPYNVDIHERYNIKNTDNKQDIFNVFSSFQYFLEDIHFSNIHNRFRKAINRLKNDIDERYFLKILDSLGFKELEKI